MLKLKKKITNTSIYVEYNNYTVDSRLSSSQNTTRASKICQRTKLQVTKLGNAKLNHSRAKVNNLMAVTNATGFPVLAYRVK